MGVINTPSTCLGGVCFQQKGQYRRFVLVEFHQLKKDACKTTGTLHIFFGWLGVDMVQAGYSQQEQWKNGTGKNGGAQQGQPWWECTVMGYIYIYIYIYSTCLTHVQIICITYITWRKIFYVDGTVGVHIHNQHATLHPWLHPVAMVPLGWKNLEKLHWLKYSHGGTP